MNGTVILVGGLQGQNAWTENFQSAAKPLNTNEAAVREAAEISNWDFKKLSYQDAQNQNPTLLEMEFDVSLQLHKILEQKKGSPIIAVGSSVGFGVLIGALSVLVNSTSPLALIGFKPIPDPLLAIELQLNNPKIIEAIKNGQIPQAPMPVESADGITDRFMLSARHLNDPAAARILSRSSSADAFNYATANTLQSSLLIYGRDDHLTPSAHMQKFADLVAGAQTQLFAVDANHSTDLTSILHNRVCRAIETFSPNC